LDIIYQLLFTISTPKTIKLAGGLTRSKQNGKTWSRESGVGEAYGLADRQSIKKPINVFLVLWRPFLNALTVVESHAVVMLHKIPTGTFGPRLPFYFSVGRFQRFCSIRGSFRETYPVLGSTVVRLLNVSKW